MKTSGGRILLKYFSTVIILFSLMSFSIYASIRRNRISTRAISTCITTTAVIATSMNKLAIFLANPAISEVQEKISVIQ
ncbi:MAG: hypothetical protein HEP71_08770 [Roseivirga sp.]|nr:hypothetical protein [Roseivirga sp.]